MRRALIFPAVLMCALGGCSVAREKVRLTFDYHVLDAGKARAEVEKQFGKPDLVSGEGDYIVARYRTIRVDEKAKETLAFSRVGLDLFTVGVGELLDPAALSENESKVLIVNYKEDRVVGDVYVECAFRGTQRKYYPGFTCSAILQG
jgi:hypothetical protein